MDLGGYVVILFLSFRLHDSSCFFFLDFWFLSDLLFYSVRFRLSIYSFRVYRTSHFVGSRVQSETSFPRTGPSGMSRSTVSGGLEFG